MYVHTPHARPPAHAPVAEQTYRDVISALPTGVTVITTEGPGGPVGCTASAVMSLSVAPPSLLVSLATASRTLDAILKADSFAVNVLGWQDRELADRFAKAPPEERFAGVPWSTEQDVPVLRDTTMTAVCRIQQTQLMLDHTVVAGTVTWSHRSEVAPTVMYRHHQHPLAR
ncbi:flavin reductase family protein [Streptomyces sp. AM 4-1-1]|uniref:flavin reductase family protein n=1 Tax=Streptomyces sp. AM 4-1-1 TaxID=3028710 RepID=UPI0023B9AA38|nr:flavin reductase family protein [Streptomyces sp. AM 4-1-1]WEH37236.1 flavin reductase family protein [Streptomyces sp. AM 4-1-1]